MKMISGSCMVNGRPFTVVHDYVSRGTYVIDESTRERKVIKSNGYMSNDLKIRKAIAVAFRLPTFRKEYAGEPGLD